MRHSVQFRHHRVSDDVFTQTKGESGLGFFKLGRNNYFFESDDFTNRVRNLDADDGLPRNRCNDPDAGGPKRQGQIIGEIYDFVDFDPGGRLVFKGRYHRARCDGHNLSADTEVCQFLFK